MVVVKAKPLRRSDSQDHHTANLQIHSLRQNANASITSQKADRVCLNVDYCGGKESRISDMSGSRSNNNSSSGFIGGLLIGSAIGAIVGLLSAPRSGRDTRQLLQKSAEALPELAEDLTTTLQLQAGRLSEAAIAQWEATLVRLQDAVQAGIEASQDVHQLSAADSASSSSVPELYPYPPPTIPPSDRPRSRREDEPPSS